MWTGPGYRSAADHHLAPTSAQTPVSALDPSGPASRRAWVGTWWSIWSAPDSQQPCSGAGNCSVSGESHTALVPGLQLTPPRGDYPAPKHCCTVRRSFPVLVGGVDDLQVPPQHVTWLRPFDALAGD